MRISGIIPTATACDEHVELDLDDRLRRRAVFTTSKGREITLDQERSQHLRGGQGFVLADGSLVGIVAKPEPVLVIRCDDAATLVRIAWHLGNRHLPTQIVAAGTGGELRIRADHVIEPMAAGLGGHCSHITAAFDPEGGAYSDHHAHDH